MLSESITNHSWLFFLWRSWPRYPRAKVTGTAQGGYQLLYLKRTLDVILELEQRAAMNYLTIDILSPCWG